jgi:hypothetical protein
MPARPADISTSDRERGLKALLVEAGALALRWQHEAFRRTAAREADKAFLPGAEELGRARFLMVRALRDAMRALHESSHDDGRAQIALAVAALVRAARIEPVAQEPVATRVEPETPRAWWVE